MRSARIRRRERGATLLTVALVLFLVMLGLALVDGALMARLRSTRDESRRVELQALVDAAMAEALANLAASAAHRGSPPHPFARGEISSRIVSTGSDRFRVAARADLGGRGLAITADVVMLWGRPAVAGWWIEGRARRP